MGNNSTPKRRLAHQLFLALCPLLVCTLHNRVRRLMLKDESGARRSFGMVCFSIPQATKVIRP